jgi:Arc/MetJ family transcription regulator
VRYARRIEVAFSLSKFDDINLDEQLIEQAQRMTGMQERTALIHEGLRALIARESARRLARLGGSDPAAKAPRRRRSS